MNAAETNGRAFPWLKDRFMIEGVMPERALLRLKRAEIGVYNVKKPQKNQILFSVSKKDSEKVFAIFPNVCYNIDGYTPYTAKKIGSVGIGKYLDRLKNRIGLILGTLLFCAVTLFMDGFVFGIDFVGTDVYAREAQAALEANGISLFSRYKSGNEDAICAELLRLDGVEFCSVKKQGLKVRVEMRLSPFGGLSPVKGDMCSKYSGTLLSLTVLKGTPLKKAGDILSAGEPIVGGYIQTDSGTQKTVEVIARAYVACTYEESLEAASEEEAFASAYLAMGLSDRNTVTEKTIEQEGSTFHVKICYTAIETLNF